MVLHGIYLPVEQTTAHVTYLGELTGLFPLLGLLPRGGSFTKFRHDASLFSRACKTNEIKITTCPSIHVSEFTVHTTTRTFTDVTMRLIENICHEQKQ